MRLSRRTAVATAVLLAAGAVPLTTAGAGAATADACDRTSWLAGTTELCAGALVYRDYVMDDYGAADPLDPTGNTVLLGALSPTAGDVRYPDPSRAGTADLVDLTVRLVDDRLVAVFELNALYDAASTIAALAVDTDADPTTGDATWQGVDGISPDGAEVTATSATGDVTANTITVELPAPDGDRWRLQALTAQADGTVMNVAFRGPDELTGISPDGSSWWEGRQATALAAGDISAFAASVDVADLRGGVTREADHAAAGHHSRVFTSAHTIGTGEGYTYTGVPGRHGATDNLCEQVFASMGRYQPYSVYVPAQLPAEPGLQLFLHGCNANHSSQSSSPGFQAQFGDALGRIIVEPLGRGPIGYYSDISEKDVLEAAADADAVYGFDEDRQFLSGYSMGGYGALRLGSLYPDRWAGVTNWVGFTGDATNNPAAPSPFPYPSGAIGNVIDLVGNLEHVPSEHLYGGADYLVHATSALAMGVRLREVGVDHRFWFHPVAEHLTFVLLDEWSKEAAASEGRVVVQDPPRVRYRTDAALAFPEYGIRHDRAYWVSTIRGAGPGYSDVDLTTAACGGSLPVRTASNGAGVEPVPWVSDELTTTGTTPITTDGLTGTLANVEALTVDAAATCLAGTPVPYALATDGPAVVALSDGREIVLPAAGTHAGVLSTAGAVPPRPVEVRDPAPLARALPATGAAPVLPAVAAALLVGAAALRRRG